MEKPAKKQPGAWVMGLFALPFAAVMLGVLALLIAFPQISLALI